MSAPDAPRGRRASDAESVGSAVTTATTSVLSTVEKYVSKLEARLIRENPNLSRGQLELLVIKEARAAHDRATLRQQEKTEGELKKLEERAEAAKAKWEIEQTFSPAIESHKGWPSSLPEDKGKKVTGSTKTQISHKQTTLPAVDLREDSPILTRVDKGKQAIRQTDTNNPTSRQKKPISSATHFETAPKRDDSYWETPLSFDDEHEDPPTRISKGKQVVRPTDTNRPTSHKKTPAPSMPQVNTAPKRDDSYWETPISFDNEQDDSWGVPAEEAEVDDWAEPELAAAKEPPLLPHPPRKNQVDPLDSAAADDADDEDFEGNHVKTKKAKLKNKNKQHYRDFTGVHESTLPRAYSPEEPVEPVVPDWAKPSPEPKKKSESKYHDPYCSDSYGDSDDSDSDPTALNITNVSTRRFLTNPDKGEPEMALHYMCNFEGCGFKCLRVRQMKTHKIDIHYVCLQCDLDFINYDALFAHKQAASIHVVCWHCGADFATTPARNRHMDAFHPDDKKIECPGCGDIHPNQTSFIMHLEQKLCKSITDEQWNKARLMVGKMKELALIEFAENEKQEKDKKRAADNLAKGITDDQNEDFGLPGLDLRQAQIVTKFPGLPRPADTTQVSSIGATSALVQKLATINPDDPMAFVSLGPKEQRLYMLYQRMVGTSSGQPILPEDKNGRIIYEGVPDHTLYDPGHFFNRTINLFLCPQSFCGKRFRTADALDAHLRSPVHMDNDLRCPECADGFRTASALMAHLEAPSVNCYIRNSDIYKEALEVASGAFLSAVVGPDGKMKVVAQEPSW